MKELETHESAEGGLDAAGRKLLVDINEALKRSVRKEHVEKIRSAIALGISLHTDQKPRADGPYPNHLLRVTKRILTDFGVTDPDVLMAAPLHDSVEDRAEKLARMSSSKQDLLTFKENAFDYLRDHFGDEAERIVRGATEEGSGQPASDEQAPALSDEEYLRIYIEHLREEIRDEKVFYVKLSDFMDNGLKIGNVSEYAQRHWLAKKYLDAFVLFIERLSRDDIQMDPERKQKVMDELQRGRTFAEETVAQSASPDWVGY